eukprot:TRINITY_DN4659_c0_g1_i1.p1 TRINITY_DN4659_c0_g1~~TRINITY_DN4659_c0_g1_i1.p1  ORF type:complete len:160 (+),score=27.43 TRINITY_DN4659_c0_g1_i1:75-554(+)
MAFIFRGIARQREWYNDLSLGERGLVWIACGNIMGAIYGTYERRGNRKAPESDYLEVSTYTVPQEHRKSFEATWSNSAQLAQRQPGYEWTKTYKAQDWEDSPFHYVTFRMWSQEICAKRMREFDPTWKELMRRMDEIGVKRESVEYKTVVDDSVRRIIH